MRGSADLGCFPTGRHYPGIAHLLRIVAAGLADEFPAETKIDDLLMVAIDTETTGRDPLLDRIVEIACVTYKAGQIVDRKSWLVNPGRPIPKEAFDIHGIGDEEVKNAPPFAAVIGEVLEAAKGAVPVAYNAEYDRTILMTEIGRVTIDSSSLPPAVRKGIEWIDPLVWARELHRLEKSRSLGEVSQRLGISLDQAHRAVHDAEAALRVFAEFLRDPRLPKTYAGLIQEQRRLARVFDDEHRLWRPRAPVAV
jgi:DNA polymerase-3 subunit epsilon